jgi:hypothetical protein
MASYFVACHANDGFHAVHDRSRCPPGGFPVGDAAEYLGEFEHPAQALAVARLRYAPARGCSCCASETSVAALAASRIQALARTPLRT